MNALHHIRIAASRLRLWLIGDPVGERLDRARCRDGAMFRRHRAYLPWAP